MLAKPDEVGGQQAARPDHLARIDARSQIGSGQAGWPRPHRPGSGCEFQDRVPSVAVAVIAILVTADQAEDGLAQEGEDIVPGLPRVAEVRQDGSRLAQPSQLFSSWRTARSPVSEAICPRRNPSCSDVDMTPVFLYCCGFIQVLSPAAGRAVHHAYLP